MSAIVVKIEAEESSKVEMLYYKYNANKDILTALIQSGISIVEGPGKAIREMVEGLFVELEKAKEEVGTKYLPEGKSIVNANYSFLFDTSEISYTF